MPETEETTMPQPPAEEQTTEQPGIVAEMPPIMAQMVITLHTNNQFTLVGDEGLMSGQYCDQFIDALIQATLQMHHIARMRREAQTEQTPAEAKPQIIHASAHDAKALHLQ